LKAPDRLSGISSRFFVGGSRGVGGCGGAAQARAGPSGARPEGGKAPSADAALRGRREPPQLDVAFSSPGLGPLNESGDVLTRI